MTKQNQYKELVNRTDLELTLVKLGVYDAHKAIVALTTRLDSHGFSYTTDEVVDMLKDI